MNPRGLRHLVVDGTDIGVGVCCCDVDSEVADLAEEACRVDVPLSSIAVRASATVGHVYIGRQHAEANKARGRLDCRPVVGVSDELGAKIQRDTARDAAFRTPIHLQFLEGAESRHQPIMRAALPVPALAGEGLTGKTMQARTGKRLVPTRTGKLSRTGKLPVRQVRGEATGANEDGKS